MTNIVLFAVTVAVYFGVWVALVKPQPLKRHIGALALIAFLAMPFSINGNVFTLLGNATGDKNVYSLLSFYQQAGNDAVSIVGIVAYQEGGKSAKSKASVAIYQKVGEKSQAFAVWSTLTRD